MNWVNKAASVCIWEIQIWRKGGRICALDLDSYQGSAGFEAPFIPFTDVGSLSSLLCLFLSIRCVLVSDSYGVVDWMCTGEPFGSHSTLTLFSLSFSPSLPFYHISLSYLLNRGALRRKGDTGESRGRPEPHSGCCSHRRGDSKRMHFHPTYGFGLWSYCSSGI